MRTITRTHNVISVVFIIIIVFTISLITGCKGKERRMKVIEPPPPYDISRDYIPSGWMGDGALANEDYIQMGQVVIDGRTCFRVSYNPGPKRWGGVYFQFPPDNWGDKPGKNLEKGYTKISFEAKGEQGGEMVEFKAGGIKNPGNPYQDSFEVTFGTVTLENVWKPYTIPLEGENLSNVIGAFAWIATKDATFYIARPINYEFSYKEETSKLTISNIKLERHNKQTTSPVQTSLEKAPKLPPGFTEKLYSVKWIAYSPTNWDPEKKIYPPAESIRNDLLILRKYSFNGIVTYAADDTISRLSKELGFRILYGIWSPNSEAELTKAKEASTNDALLGYICGNEGLGSRYDLATLEHAMKELSATGKPVTTTEELHDYYNPRVLELGDWVCPNAHAYFQNITDPQLAVRWTVERYQEIASKTSKPVLFKEVGLPTAGDAKLSEQKQAEYYRLLQQTDVHFVYFEAYDQPWKDHLPIEPHWGLFRSDRTPKWVVKHLPSK